jgi:hypothetical protein
MRRQYAPIVWLVVISVLALAVIPHHYHLHHESAPDSVSHEHDIDLHIFSDTGDAAHHDEAIVFDAAQDGLLKPPGDNLLALLLTVFLLAWLPLVKSRIAHPLYDTVSRLRQALYHLTPPLRAPPRQ